MEVDKKVSTKMIKSSLKRKVSNKSVSSEECLSDSDIER